MIKARALGYEWGARKISATHKRSIKAADVHKQISQSFIQSPQNQPESWGSGHKFGHDPCRIGRAGHFGMNAGPDVVRCLWRLESPGQEKVKSTLGIGA